MIHIMLSANAPKLNIPKPPCNITYFLESPSNPHFTPKNPFFGCEDAVVSAAFFPFDRSATFSKYIRFGAKPGTIVRIGPRWREYKDQIRQTKTDSDTENHAHPDISGIALRCGPWSFLDVRLLCHVLLRHRNA